MQGGPPGPRRQLRLSRSPARAVHPRAAAGRRAQRAPRGCDPGGPGSAPRHRLRGRGRAQVTVALRAAPELTASMSSTYTAARSLASLAVADFTGPAPARTRARRRARSGCRPRPRPRPRSAGRRRAPFGKEVARHDGRGGGGQDGAAAPPPSSGPTSTGASRGRPQGRAGSQFLAVAEAWFELGDLPAALVACTT